MLLELLLNLSERILNMITECKRRAVCKLVLLCGLVLCVVAVGSADVVFGMDKKNRLETRKREE